MSLYPSILSGWWPPPDIGFSMSAKCSALFLAIFVALCIWQTRAGLDNSLPIPGILLFFAGAVLIANSFWVAWKFLPATPTEGVQNIVLHESLLVVRVMVQGLIGGLALFQATEEVPEHSRRLAWFQLGLGSAVYVLMMASAAITLEARWYRPAAIRWMTAHYLSASMWILTTLLVLTWAQDRRPTVEVQQ